MKKIIVILAIILPVILFLHSCFKHEEKTIPYYPSLMQGAWQIYNIDGVDVSTEKLDDDIIFLFEAEYITFKNYPFKNTTKALFTKFKPLDCYHLYSGSSTSTPDFYISIKNVNETECTLHLFYKIFKSNEEYNEEEYPTYVLKGHKLKKIE